MNLKALLKLAPSWKHVLKEFVDDDFEVTKKKLKALTLTSATLYPLSTMWVDSGSDSSADVLVTLNLKEVYQKELGHASNMTSTTLVYEKIKAHMPGYVLISGVNEDEKPFYTLYHC